MTGLRVLEVLAEAPPLNQATEQYSVGQQLFGKRVGGAKGEACDLE